MNEWNIQGNLLVAGDSIGFEMEFDSPMVPGLNVTASGKKFFYRPYWYDVAMFYAPLEYQTGAKIEWVWA